MSPVERKFADAQVKQIETAVRELGKKLTDEPSVRVLQDISDRCGWLKIRLQFDRDEG